MRLSIHLRHSLCAMMFLQQRFSLSVSASPFLKSVPSSASRSQQTDPTEAQILLTSASADESANSGAIDQDVSVVDPPDWVNSDGTFPDHFNVTAFRGCVPDDTIHRHKRRRDRN
ncbi:hypothetical protein BLNAU_20381 [Blattamonas nauphoetae]|uniref:Secreted protein n=1 Tax=Blattamonas nauphoetae TaxID=2049346 RepID=A0ABQ9WZH5_9EUKA|nr:hypothetical protein BLNAU_20381 [Blattamonas nauphoetae]